MLKVTQLESSWGKTETWLSNAKAPTLNRYPPQPPPNTCMQIGWWVNSLNTSNEREKSFNHSANVYGVPTMCLALCQAAGRWWWKRWELPLLPLELQVWGKELTTTINSEMKWWCPWERIQETWTWKMTLAGGLLSFRCQNKANEQMKSFRRWWSCWLGAQRCGVGGVDLAMT